MEDYILQMEHVTKTFPGVKALDDVTFQVKRGEIHSLVGENGAGKSTLMKVLSGIYPYGDYTGKILINGEEQRFRGIKDSERAGIAIIYQELGLVSSMNVCDNIFLGNEMLKNKRIDWDGENARCKELLSMVGLDVGTDVEVGTLGTGKQQLIEIAKALNKKTELLILDEPTASLTEKESENLMNLLLRLKKEGITCIFISHRLAEVMKISDSITVLRDGQTISTRAAGEFTEDSMIACMVGREMKEIYPRKEHKAGEVLMEIQGLTVRNPEIPEKYLLDHVDMKVRKGEITALAGLMGAGRTELAMSIYGAMDAKVSGKLFMNGEEIPIPSSPRKAIDQGIGYLSEDRKRYGLVLSSDIKTNITMSSLDKISKNGIIDKDAELGSVHQYVEELQVKTPSIYQITGNLSGGNQQKVVLAKTLMPKPKVIFLDEPTRGIDVGAKYEIYQIINELVEEGIGVVMISSDLPEVLGIADRIYVMHEGKIRGELVYGEDLITQEKVLYYAAGGKK